MISPKIMRYDGVAMHENGKVTYSRYTLTEIDLPKLINDLEQLDEFIEKED